MPQSEVIRAILSEDSPFCGVPAPPGFAAGGWLLRLWRLRSQAELRPAGRPARPPVCVPGDETVTLQRLSVCQSVSLAQPLSV